MLENQKISGGDGCGSYVAGVCGSEGVPLCRLHKPLPHMARRWL